MQLDKIEFRRMFLPSQNITCDVNESFREKKLVNRYTQESTSEATEFYFRTLEP